MSAEPEAVYCPSVVSATERTLSAWPSNVFRTPVVLRSQLFNVLSQEDETMHRPVSPVCLLVSVVTASAEVAARWPFMVRKSGPPGRCCKGMSGMRGDWQSSKAASSRRSSTGLKWSMDSIA